MGNQNVGFRHPSGRQRGVEISDIEIQRVGLLPWSGQSLAGESSVWSVVREHPCKSRHRGKDGVIAPMLVSKTGTHVIAGRCLGRIIGS